MSTCFAHLSDPFWRSGPARRESGKDPIQMIARVSRHRCGGAPGFLYIYKLSNRATSSPTCAVVDAPPRSGVDGLRCFENAIRIKLWSSYACKMKQCPVRLT